MSKIGRRWGRLAWLPAMLTAGIWSGCADGKLKGKVDMELNIWKPVLGPQEPV